MDATASGYIQVSSNIQGILFSIPMVGLAVGILWLRDKFAEARREVEARRLKVEALLRERETALRKSP